jgi:hypothetical protein
MPNIIIVVVKQYLIGGFMLETKFQEIEQRLLPVLRSFLEKTTDIDIEELRRFELSGLIDDYKKYYHQISAKMEWNATYSDKEPMNRALLIKAARNNRYYHFTCETKIDRFIELADATNILVFVKSMDKIMREDTQYLETVKLLEYIVLHIFNTEHKNDNIKVPEIDTKKLKVKVGYIGQNKNVE